MVAQFLRLRISTLGNILRRPPLQAFGLIVGFLAAVALVFFLAGVIASLRDGSADIARAVIIAIGSAVLLAFAVAPLAFGADDALEPRRFALLGIPVTKLTLLLSLAALVSIPIVSVAVLAVAQVVAWSRDGGPVGLALLVVPIIVATCVLLGRVGSAIAARYLSTRRRREAAGLAVFALVVLLAPVSAVLATVDWGSQGLPIIRRIATVATWTPFGAVWSVPGDAAIGRMPDALAKLAIAVAFVVVLAVAWRVLVGRMLVTPRLRESRRPYRGLGWFGALPATPFGAVAARSLSYWSRDSRYLVAIAVVPVVPLIMIGTLAIAGIPTDVILWLPVPIMCLFLGWSVHNDVAQDSTAFWLHLSTSTAGSADRLGRIIPPLLIGIPLIAIGTVGTSWIVGNWTVLPALIGLSVCVLLTALGVASVTSAALPYPTILPGASPFAQPQAASGAGAAVQAFSLLIPIALSAPVIWLIVLGAADPHQYGTALAAGLTIGFVAVVFGVLWGGRILDKHSPELLEFTLQN
ncbi:ABC-2 type transport system permease protein [Leifsonia sp. AK011]|uniref:hypothetical protein n=1 Tax=Leifsonia sp. AK011 TaxID=2723075 RepID=UPI0015CD8D54|nr:hypothetical protein [Leifsonia sp. AK011]NYF10233.1 ABC-2 type transport system permease protein [Leifsonia sp. AK011]